MMDNTSLQRVFFSRQNLTRADLERMEEAGKRVSLWDANRTNPSSFGFIVAATIVARTPASTNFYTRKRRVGLSSPNSGAGGGVGGVQSWRTYSDWYIQDGFISRILFGLATNFPKQRAAVGIAAASNVGILNTTTATEPSQIQNCLLMIQEQGAKNWQVRWNDGTNTITQDLGDNFPCDTAESDFYELRIVARFGKVGYVVRRLNTDHVAEDIFDTISPSGAGVSPHVDISNWGETAPTTNAIIDVSQIKMVWDY